MACTNNRWVWRYDRFYNKKYVTPKEKVNATSTSAFTYTGWAGDSIYHNNVQPYIVTYLINLFANILQLEKGGKIYDKCLY